MEAARFVVSDAVELLWRTLLDRYGFAGFADRAAPQLIRWESRFGWTRSRAHKLVYKVLAELPGHREAIAFAEKTKAPLPPGAAKLLEERSKWDPSLPAPW